MVKHTQAWTCNCPDHVHRGVLCKHIHAVQFWTKARNTLDDDVMDLGEEITDRMSCPHCKSEDIIKSGVRKTKKGNRHRYLCKSCNKRFVDAPMMREKANPKVIALTMDLYFKGLSLRDIEGTINQFYGLNVDHSTIGRWIKKFTEKMNTYVKKQQIKKVSKQWKMDEQVIKAEGECCWAWNILDPETKYLLGSNLSEWRTADIAVDTLKKATEWTGVRPEQIVTDKLAAYVGAIRKAYPIEQTGDKKVRHIRYKGIRNKEVHNNDLERYHGTFREFDKVRRGFFKHRTGKENVDGFRTYYNYIREHSELGTTPAEAAGIDLNLGENKMLGLMMASLNPI